MITCVHIHTNIKSRSFIYHPTIIHYFSFQLSRTSYTPDMLSMPRERAKTKKDVMIGYEIKKPDSTCAYVHSTPK
jgi:hypothetical protein